MQNFSTNQLYLQKAETEDIKKRIYDLRYEAYINVNAVMPDVTKRFKDEYDNFPNVTSYLLCQGKEAIGSIRACVYSATEGQEIPAFSTFFKEISSNIGLNKNIVEINRYTVHPNFQSNDTQYNLYLFKAISMECLLSEADYIIASVRKKHVPFYKRVMKFETISDEKIYNIRSPSVLLAGEHKKTRAHIIDHLPYINPTPLEIEEYKKCGILRF